MFYRLMILFIAGMLVASCSVISGTSQDAEKILQRLDLNALKVKQKTEMMLAAEQGNSTELKRTFSAGDRINAIAPEGTAFSLALKNGHASIARILLSAGSQWQPGFADENSSALIVAANQGFDSLVKLLIMRGAVLDHLDSEGYSALAKAAIKGHLTTLKILINAGAKVDIQPLGRSVLMHVVEDNNMLISQQLIAAGADVNFQDEQGDSALSIARRQGYYDLDLMLVQSGARP